MSIKNLTGCGSSDSRIARRFASVTFPFEPSSVPSRSRAKSLITANNFSVKLDYWSEPTHAHKHDEYQK